MRRQEAPGNGLVLFGAPLDTGNLGVSALGLATMAAVARRSPSPFTVFDNGRGARPASVTVGDTHIDATFRGAWISRRFHRSESLWTMLAASRSNLPNNNIRAIERSRGVLDISGGDSFTDLYGRRRFDLVTLPKRIALELERPLILLPQTYGPFQDPALRRRARALIERADQAWARDAASFEQLRELLGQSFDAQRHLLGVDVAFALPATDPGERIGELSEWLDDDLPPIGINVSGLLANDAGAARRRFGIEADYPTAIRRFVNELLRSEDRRVVLVPHVRGPGPESDDLACDRLRHALGDERVSVLPRGLGADEIKHVIGRLEWFTGSRMHATIAALSSGVPAAATAYSDKFRGVFEGCGIGHAVLDLRQLSTDELFDRLMASWSNRATDRAAVGAAVPSIVRRADSQFDHIIAGLEGIALRAGERA